MSASRLGGPAFALGDLTTMESSGVQTEKGSGYGALCRWISERSPESSYLSIQDDSSLKTKQTSAPFPGAIGVYSSGSTGKPKLFWKDIDRLQKDCIKHPKHEACTWATCFYPSSFAGAQVAVQAVASGGSVLPLSKKWAINHQLLLQSKPEILTATPTFLAWFAHTLKDSPIRQWQPQQITLGGEPIRPTTAAILRDNFPSSRVTLIYASAELGIIAKSHRADGWFPFHSLEKRFDGWRLQDGELQLLRNKSWIQTGDHCEIEKDYFRITGRMDRVINVGGFKVSLDDIETKAEAFPEVARALAFAKENPLTGHVVALILEPSTPLRNQSLLDKILHSMHEQLPKPAWPRWIAWGKVREWNNGKRNLYPNI